MKVLNLDKIIKIECASMYGLLDMRVTPCRRREQQYLPSSSRIVAEMELIEINRWLIEAARKVGQPKYQEEQE